MKTKHVRLNRPNITFEGAHLFKVTGSTWSSSGARVFPDDHETKIVAADDEQKARTRFMAVTTMKPHGKELTFVVEQLPDPKRVSVSAARIQALSVRTFDAHSFVRYASWKACAAAVLRRGYTDRQAEEILRSKFMRWAADQSDAPYGYATAQDLLRFMDRCQGQTRALLEEVTALEH